ncbi:MAG: hypothetical protein ACI8WA_000014 [Polaribacter sp.]|jgi:hypothetical protein
MIFQFDSKIAEDYGINEAVFVHNIFFWINHNKANNKHCYEDKYWTYNTKMAYVKLFPFWTYEQVKKIIRNLVEKDVLLTANFNENSWDKTLWYTLTDEVLFYYESMLNPSKNALVQKQQSSVAKTTVDSGNNNNRMLQKQLSYIGTDNKTHIIKPDSENALAFFKDNFPSRYEKFLMEYKSKIKDFAKFEKLIELKMEEESTPYEQKPIIARIERFAINFIENDTKVIRMNHQQPEQKQAYQDLIF